MKVGWLTLRQAIVLLFITTQLPESQQNKCEKALRGKQCDQIYSMLLQQPRAQSPQICRFQRMRFMNRCSPLILVEHHEPTCTQECRKVLNLLNKRLRSNFLFCNCHGDLDCLWFQQRAYRCMNETLKYKKNCDIERQKCEKDENCVQLYGKWFMECQKMFNGYKCPVSCLLAEKKLYSDPIGQSLETCECAGSKVQEKFCRSVRLQKEKLCKKPDLEQDYVVVNGYLRNNNGTCPDSLPMLETRSSSTTRFDAVKTFEIIILTNFIANALAFFVTV